MFFISRSERLTSELGVILWTRRIKDFVILTHDVLPFTGHTSDDIVDNYCTIEEALEAYKCLLDYNSYPQNKRVQYCGGEVKFIGRYGVSASQFERWVVAMYIRDNDLR